MTKIISIDGVEITQKNFQQILIRGDGKENLIKLLKKKFQFCHHQRTSK